MHPSLDFAAEQDADVAVDEGEYGGDDDGEMADSQATASLSDDDDDDDSTADETDQSRVKGHSHISQQVDKSGYHGVKKKKVKWTSMIYLPIPSSNLDPSNPERRKATVSLGAYVNAEDAARAYDQVAYHVLGRR